VTTAPVLARDLGARGSRTAVAGADPAEVCPPAAAAVLAAACDWWSGRAAAAGLTGSWLDVTVAVGAPPPAAALTATADAAVGTVPSGEDLGTAYVSALSPQVRARHGRHYTPAALASHLWRMTRRALGQPQAARRLPGLIRDPACGAGALLLPAIREHITASVRTDPQVALAALPHLVEGVDADPAAAWLASVILAAEALPLLAAVPAARRRQLPALARTGDGLEAPETPARAVVMNPPYGRVRLTAEDRARWGHVLYGHANLYGLFLGAALKGLDDRGVLAALVPTSFTSGLYFSRLRDTLAAQAPLREAAFVVDRGGVFTGVLQETCLAVFTRDRTRRTTIVSLDATARPVAQVAAPRGGRPWLLPRRADDAVTAAAAAKMPARLTDLGYRCSTGPLVWNRRQADLHSRASDNRATVIWGADLDGGKLHQDPARDQSRYLELGGSDHQVMLLSEPAVLVQRTTAPEQARRLVASELSPEQLTAWGGHVVVENHVNVLRPTTPYPTLDRAALTRVLATRTLDRVLRCLSGSVAVSAYELESIPFPDSNTVRAWNTLYGDELEEAVTAAYRITNP